MQDIAKAFTTTGEPISEFFQRPGVGFYIPLYQREYSWDKENIDQLMEDICRGVETLLEDDNAIRFMGTVILVKEKNPHENVKPKDSRALPQSIENIIDGQQRLSTIALLACVLYKKFFNLEKKLPDNDEFSDLKDAILSHMETLYEIFSVDLKRGTPRRKPIIIRGSIDCWSFKGREEDFYQSHVSLYISQFIRAIEDEANFPTPHSTSNLVGKNIRNMEKWLTSIEKNQVSDDDNIFPTANEIVNKISEEYIWSYSRPELVKIINDAQETSSLHIKVLCSLVKLLAFSHFLLDRCCFTIIVPTSDNWAFDMFQSLNASGTPLTAIETFKPIVVNSVNGTEGNFKESDSEAYFMHVDTLLSGQKTAAQKSKLTNEFLTSFALIHDGSKLSRQFSEQRLWLQNHYMNFPDNSGKQEFVQQIGNHACYYLNVLYHNFNKGAIHGLISADKEERDIASLAILFLQDSNHRMANTILSRFYSMVLRGKQEYITEFIGAAKSLAAFFALWRAAFTNAGLDNIYRTLLRGDQDKGIPKFSWEGDNNNLTVNNLNSYLKEVLKNKGINTKDLWLKKAEQELSYDKARTVCKFALFISSHDTINDKQSPGLMKKSTRGVSCYMTPDQWQSDDFNNIEHIAPQVKTSSDWDEELYEQDLIHKIGNLTLLPTDVNSSASNKGWLEKHIYYRHLAETDAEALQLLAKEAEQNGIILSEDTIEMLKNTKHKHHIIPIVSVGSDGSWDSELVKKRTNRICDILWDEIAPWVGM